MPFLVFGFAVLAVGYLVCHALPTIKVLALLFPPYNVGTRPGSPRASLVPGTAQRVRKMTGTSAKCTRDSGTRVPLARGTLSPSAPGNNTAYCLGQYRTLRGDSVARSAGATSPMESGGVR
eukprot:1790102-Rhodomonas_salina.10